MAMIQGLRTVIYPVTDLGAATVWYRRVLDLAPYFEEPFYVGFEVGGFELGLIPDGEPGASGAIAYWGTPDVAAELERLAGLGATIETPVTDVGGGIRVASLKDPFGNIFGVIENPHFDRAKVR
jgi:predicted enzyme related to lactoylglutathione lyase